MLRILPDFQLAFYFEQTRTDTIFGENGTMAHFIYPESEANQSCRIALSNDPVFNNVCCYIP